MSKICTRTFRVRWGELDASGTVSPAITNAIYNAVGVRVDRLPVDQEMIAKELWEREGK